MQEMANKLKLNPFIGSLAIIIQYMPKVGIKLSYLCKNLLCYLIPGSYSLFCHCSESLQFLLTFEFLIFII